jgi:hypothetical protein
LVFVLSGIATGYAQEKSDSQQITEAKDPSLGDVARQLKARKAKLPKPVMVITNDNIGTLTAGAEIAPSPQVKDIAKPAAERPTAPAPAHDEAYFRSRMSELQNQLDVHKRELAVLQQKLGQNQVQYYPNPQDSLMQQYTRSDIDKLTAEIDAKKQQIADDEKAIEDLHEQLRHEGGDPGWLR